MLYREIIAVCSKTHTKQINTLSKDIFNVKRGVKHPTIKHLSNYTNQTYNIYSLRIYLLCGQDSSVGIATGYGLDGPGIESRWERDLPHLSRTALGPTQPPVQWVPALSRG